MAGPTIYLTFDDGPDAGTSYVLDVLGPAQVSATFFLCMIYLNDSPDQQYKLISSMLARGHALGSHGYDHNPKSKKGYENSTTAEVKADYVTNQTKLDALFRANGKTAQSFPIARLPGDGRFQPNFVRMITGELKLPHAGWDFEFAPMGRTDVGHVSHNNWQGVTGVAATFSTLPKANDIVLLHDLHWEGKTTLFTSLIGKLKEHFTFATLAPVPGGLKSIRYPA